MNLLDTDLNSLDTSLPLLQPGLYRLRVVESAVDQNAAGDGEIWRLRMETMEPATGMRGEKLAAGYPVFSVISLTPKGNATEELIARNVASVVQAVVPKLDEPLPASTIFSGGWSEVAPKFAGRTLEARIGYQPERTDERTGRRFAAQSVVERFVKAS